MASSVLVNGDLKPCCADLANREVESQTATLLIQRCKVCGRKHYRAFMNKDAKE